MKRAIMLISLIICLATKAGSQETGRFMAGTDIAKAICGRASLRFSFGFALKWSADACVSLDLTQMKNPILDEESVHDSEFTTSGRATEPALSRDYQSWSMSIRYWPDGRFRKWFIAAGIEHGDMRGPDMTAEAGYMLNIWKGISITASYAIRVRESIRLDKPASSGISICISYTF